MSQNAHEDSHFIPFLVSFVVTLLLLVGVLSLSIITHTSSTATATAADEYDGPATVYLPRSEDRLVLLLAAAERDDTTPDVYLLAGFLPDKGSIAICVLPPKLMVAAGEQWGTLDELFARGGMDYTAKVLGSYLGVPIARQGLIDVQGLRRVMEEAGSYEYELSVELDYPMHQRQVALSRGVQLLDGRKLMDILAYPAYKGGDAERCDRGSMLLTRMVNDYLPRSMTAQGDTLIKSLLNNSESNIAFVDYELRKAPTRFLAQLRLPAATAVYIEGSLSRDYSSFLLTESCRARLTSVFAGEGFALAEYADTAAARIGAYDNVADEPKVPVD